MRIPTNEWQAKVKQTLLDRGMSYAELADAIGAKEGYVRQLMCDTYAHIAINNPTKVKITEYLEL